MIIYDAKDYKVLIIEYKPIEVMRLGNGKISPLQRFVGGVIDFDKIARITNAYHVDHMGHGGHFVSFDIIGTDGKSVYNFFASIPISYKEITKEEYESLKDGKYSWHMKDVRVFDYSGINGRKEYYTKTFFDIDRALIEVQKSIVDDILNVWRDYKEGK